MTFVRPEQAGIGSAAPTLHPSSGRVPAFERATAAGAPGRRNGNRAAIFRRDPWSLCIAKQNSLRLPSSADAPAPALARRGADPVRLPLLPP